MEARKKNLIQHLLGRDIQIIRRRIQQIYCFLLNISKIFQNLPRIKDKPTVLPGHKSKMAGHVMKGFLQTSIYEKKTGPNQEMSSLSRGRINTPEDGWT